MSLINQMLRDLKTRNEKAGQDKAIPLRSSVTDRIPYLPLPVVLGGTGLVLVLLIWWLAGVLSESLFRFEPDPAQVAGGTAVQQQAAVPEPTPVVVTTEKETLSSAERAAEPEFAPAATPARETPAAPPVQPETIVTRSPEPPPRTAQVKARPVPPREPVARVASAPAAEPVVVARTAPSQPPRMAVQASPARQVEPLPAKAPVRRLHPDDLPGAIMSTSREMPVRTPGPSRVAPLPSSPYGAAEQAYQDAIWANEQKRAALATHSLQKALEIYPGHLPARTLLVELFAREGKTGEAMYLLADGLEIVPDYLPFKKQYARLLIDQGDHETAAKVLLAGGVPTVEDDPETHVILASVYQRLGEAFLAAQTYRNLLVAWPQTGAFWVGLGGALEAQRLSDEAVECYRRALATDNLRQDLNAFATRRLGLLE